MSLADDIVSVIRSDAPSAEGVMTRAQFEAQGRMSGAVVEQRSGSDVDQQTDTETVRADITVYGTAPGGNDLGRGRERSYERAWQIYRALRAVYDREVNGHYYIRIMADTAPTEAVQRTDSGVAYGYTLGVECVVWLGYSE